MSFKNLALQWKVICLLALLGLVSCGVIVYASVQIEAINDVNSSIIEGPATATTALARGNRDIRQVEAGLFAMAIAASKEEVTAANGMVDLAMASYDYQMSLATKAYPDGAEKLNSLAEKTKQVINGPCKGAVSMVKAGSPAFRTMQSSCLTAIDKQGVRVLEQLFLAHADRGGMVVLTTHQDLTLMQGRLKTLSLTSLLQE